MSAVVQMFPQSSMEASIHNYPPEASYGRWGTGASIGFHALLIGAVLLVAYINHIRTLTDLLGAAIVDQLPPDQIQIVLPPDNDEPPPTNDPQFIIQHIIAQTPPPPPPPPKPKPKPKPTPMIAPHTVVRQEAHTISLGSSGLPAPRYPSGAQHQHIEGTVVYKVEFDGSGSASYVSVISSSGSSELDEPGRQDILDHWRDKPAYANQTVKVPIQFQLPHH